MALLSYIRNGSVLFSTDTVRWMHTKTCEHHWSRNQWRKYCPLLSILTCASHKHLYKKMRFFYHQIVYCIVRKKSALKLCGRRNKLVALKIRWMLRNRWNDSHIFKNNKNVMSIIFLSEKLLKIMVVSFKMHAIWEKQNFEK